MIKGKKVSVIVITYNQASYISQALDSILMQKTNFDFEIVIGNDCSSDETRKILDNYAKNNPSKIRLFNREKNLGPTKNFYETLKSCKGDYLSFLEGDDFWTDDNKLQFQYDFLISNSEYIGIAHDFNDVDLNGNFICKHSDNFIRKPKIYKFSDAEKGYLDFHINSLMCKNIFINSNVDATILYRADYLIGDRTVPTILTDFGNIYISKKIMGSYRTCPNRHVTKMSLFTIKVLRMMRVIEKYPFVNHKIDYSYYKASEIVDCFVLSLARRECIKLNEYKIIFEDFSLKIFVLCLYHLFKYVLIFPIRLYKIIVRNRKYKKMRGIKKNG